MSRFRFKLSLVVYMFAAGFTEACAATVSLTVSPRIALLKAGQSQQFKAAVTGQPNAAIVWRVNGAVGGNSAAGTVTPDGTYTAPAAASASQIVLTASSDAAGALSSTAVIQIIPSRLDAYGGMTELPSPNGATGFFRLEKNNGRWTFVTPDGNLFWLKSVYNAVEAWIDRGVLTAQYNNDANLWATHRNLRLLSWGFNTLGEYTAARGLPVKIFGAPPNPVALPYIMILSGVLRAYTSYAAEGIVDPPKDIMAGVPKAVYNTWRGTVADAYDAKIAQVAANNARNLMNVVGGGFADKPWVVGITLDETDRLYGFGGGPGEFNASPHIGYLVAVTKFQYTPDEHPKRQEWLDPKVYGKYAWIDYLKSKHAGIDALNEAWGTNRFYTSFDDDGGYGTGTGVIDEDGRHAWMGKMRFPFVDTGANPGVQADLDGFLYEFARTYAESTVKVIRAVDQNHLIFGPSALKFTREPIIRGLADGGIDAFCVGDGTLNVDAVIRNAKHVYEVSGKPVFIWHTVTANADSGMPMTPAKDAGDQANRAAVYAGSLSAFVNAQAGNGDYFILGVDWWELVDNLREKVNFGLLTNRNNAYNGKEAVQAIGTDPWGYATGGEAADYGDFLSGARRANFDVLQLLLDSMGPARRGVRRPTHPGRR